MPTLYLSLQRSGEGKAKPTSTPPMFLPPFRRYRNVTAPTYGHFINFLNLRLRRVRTHEAGTQHEHIVTLKMGSIYRLECRLVTTFS